ncbi:MAG: peptidoglycan DD-metalloendopeptidase family protein [Gammaproteobacteria bacterium]|nr:peptidoglycan DD-metalloendopeptidase family protein [Gammaproteobacteria bacterium]
MRAIISLYGVIIIAGVPPLAASEIREEYNYPGGVVDILLARKSDILPQVKYGTREPIVIQQLDYWRVLIGVSLDTLPGEYVLYVKEPESELPAYSVQFDVNQKTYPVLELASVKQPRNIHYDSTTDLDFSNTEQPELPLMLPAQGQWANFFGHVVVYPDQDPDSSEVIVQNYVSLTTTELATVTAPQNAIVSRVLVEQEPPGLATVFLDHGRGLYSIISGLADLSVEKGNGVVAGAVIGKLPVSQDTPAELIWQCVINGVYINPLVMTQIE